jgi:preprotein translocase subunit SecE
VSKVTQQQEKDSSVQMILAIFIALGSLVMYYLDPLELITTLYKTLVLLAGLIVAGFVLFQSPQGRRLKTFFAETKIELRKVVWPNRDETVKTTVMILIAVVIVSIFLWMIDSIFSWLVTLLVN